MNGENKRFRLIFIASLLLLYGVVIILVIEDKLSWFDLPIITFIQSFESDWLTSFMEFFTIVGSAKIVIPISIVFILFSLSVLKHRLEIMFFIITLIGSTLLNHILKSFFHRERPSIHRIVEEVGYSFPSGHSMAAFTLYFLIGYLIWKHVNTQLEKSFVIILVTFMIIVIGLSRVYLGVHYPSDIIGGYLTSALWVSLTLVVYNKLKSKHFTT